MIRRRFSTGGGTILTLHVPQNIKHRIACNFSPRLAVSCCSHQTGSDGDGKPFSSRRCLDGSTSDFFKPVQSRKISGLDQRGKQPADAVSQEFNSIGANAVYNTPLCAGIRILGSVASRALFKGHLQGHLKASSRTPSRSPPGHLHGILGSVAERAPLKKKQPRGVLEDASWKCRSYGRACRTP